MDVRATRGANIRDNERQPSGARPNYRAIVVPKVGRMPENDPTNRDPVTTAEPVYIVVLIVWRSGPATTRRK
jgi:hypothetical protein